MLSAWCLIRGLIQASQLTRDVSFSVSILQETAVRELAQHHLVSGRTGTRAHFSLAQRPMFSALGSEKTPCVPPQKQTNYTQKVGKVSH